MLLGQSCHQYHLLIVAMYDYYVALVGSPCQSHYQQARVSWQKQPPSWEDTPLDFPKLPDPDPDPSLVFPCFICPAIPM